MSMEVEPSSASEGSGGEQPRPGVRPPKVRISKLSTAERKRLMLGRTSGGAAISRARLEQQQELLRNGNVRRLQRGGNSSGAVGSSDSHAAAAAAGGGGEGVGRVQDFVNLRSWGRDGISEAPAAPGRGERAQQRSPRQHAQQEQQPAARPAPQYSAATGAGALSSSSSPPPPPPSPPPPAAAASAARRWQPQLGNLEDINKRLEDRRGAQQVLTDILSAGAAEMEQLIVNYGKAGMITEALLDVVIARAKLALENDEMEAVGALRLVFKRLQAERRRVNASGELRLLDVLLRPNKTDAEIRRVMEAALLPPDLVAVDLGMDTVSACFAIAQEGADGDGDGDEEEEGLLFDLPAERVDLPHFCNLLNAMLQGATEDEEGRLQPPEGVSEEACVRLVRIREVVHGWLARYPHLLPAADANAANADAAHADADADADAAPP